MRRVLRQWGQRKWRTYVGVTVVSLALCWIVTHTWGTAGVRNAMVERLAADLSWNERAIQSDAVLPLPDALNRRDPFQFVGQGAAILPFLVRIDVGAVHQRGGMAERVYVVWFFGMSRQISSRPLWQFEAHDGVVHGTDYGNKTIYVSE